MKKIYIFLISFVAGACLAIGGYMLVDYLIQGNNNPQPVPNEQQEELQDEPQDEQPDQPQYKSPDLKMMQAKGNVRTIEGSFEEFSYWTESKKIIFNRDGVFAFTLDKKFLSELEGEVERDEYGRFITINALMLGNTINSFEYNNDGFIAKYYFSMEGCSSTTRYEYNDNDDLVKKISTSECVGLGERYTSETTYSNYKYDSHGNWISRKCKTVSKNYDEFDELMEANTSNDTETRKITYYE